MNEYLKCICLTPRILTLQKANLRAKTPLLDRLKTQALPSLEGPRILRVEDIESKHDS